MIEAMSCGTVVVSSKTGGIVEFIDNGISSFLADDFNSEDEFFHLINKALFASNYRSICDAARKKICDNFAWEKTASDLKNVYLHILS